MAVVCFAKVVVLLRMKEERGGQRGRCNCAVQGCEGTIRCKGKIV